MCSWGQYLHFLGEPSSWRPYAIHVGGDLKLGTASSFAAFSFSLLATQVFQNSSIFLAHSAESLTIVISCWRYLPQNVKSGLLPGDFAVTIEKEGVKLGIVGLNTSFLQLADGNYEGKLALHTQQFHAVCGGNGPAWTQDHQVQSQCSCESGRNTGS